MKGNELRTALSDVLNDLDKTRQRMKELLDDLDATAEAIQVPRQGRWTKAMVAQLWEVSRHLGGVATLFAVTAARPNKEVTFTEIMEASGLDEMQQRNEHARLSRLSAEIFGEKKWPIEAWQGPKRPGTDKAEMLYRMGGTVADWWLDIAE